MILEPILVGGLSLLLSAFPEAPDRAPSDTLQTVVWTAVDSAAHATLDSLTVQLAMVAGDSAASPQDLLDLISSIQEVEGDSGSAASVRRDILLENARETYTRIAGRLEELPEDVDPDVVMMDLGLTDTAASAEPPEESLELSPTSELGSLPDVVHPDRLPPIPMVLNADVERALVFFQTRGRKVMQKWFDRSAEVIPELMPHLREAGLPEEMIYLSMIESGFRYDARSYAKAVGPWQFIKGTGKRYGLRINNWYDERRDPELSTRAAAAYLTDLYYMFDDWYLAMASYNCGEGKVDKHVRRYGHDFWVLNRLPKQTRNYVPTYIAARMIAEDPDRYGFWMPKRLRIQPTEKVYITQCIDLAAIAECANIDVETLRGLNPALLRTTTPPGGDSTLVRLPAGSIAMGFWDRLASVPAAKKTDLVIHTVRRGETIGAIAASYGVPIDVIAEYPDNHIGRRYLLQVGQNLVIPVASGDSHKRSVARKQPKPSIDDGIHVVARGETLMEISRQTGITVERLAALNGLTNTTTIFPGQILKLDGTPPAELAALASGKDSQHIVSSGDTLWQIAKKYGVSVEALRKVNGLHARSLIKPGQKLAIPVVN